MEKENAFDNIPLGYFNALMTTVTGTEEQIKEAKEFLAKSDPEIWGS